MAYAAVRLRGLVNVNPDIRKTLELLNLTRVNHCVLIQKNPTTDGMLQVVKDFITWGEIDKKTLKNLIEKRGRMIGDKKLTDADIKNSTSYDNVDKLSDAIISDKFKYKDISNVKPIFRLSPAKNGLKSIKRPYNKKGSVGYRGNDINKLLEKMI